MSGLSHRTISRRDWKHDLGRCSACGAGELVRLDDPIVKKWPERFQHPARPIAT